MSEIAMKMSEKGHKNEGDSYSLKDRWPLYFISITIFCLQSSLGVMFQSIILSRNDFVSVPILDVSEVGMFHRMSGACF